jgi:hypothetical protein
VRSTSSNTWSTHHSSSALRLHCALLHIMRVVCKHFRLHPVRSTQQSVLLAATAYVKTLTVRLRARLIVAANYQHLCSCKNYCVRHLTALAVTLLWAGNRYCYTFFTVTCCIILLCSDVVTSRLWFYGKGLHTIRYFYSIQKTAAATCGTATCMKCTIHTRMKQL